MEATLSEVFSYLLLPSSQSLFVRILGCLRKEYSTKFPSMAVALRNRHFTLFCNPEWIKTATYDDVIATIDHEALHVVLDHIPRALGLMARLEITKDNMRRFTKASMLGADMAVNTLLVKENEYVKHTPDKWILPGQKPWEDFSTDDSYENYTKQLMQWLKQHEIIIKIKGMPGQGPPQQGSEESGDGASIEVDLGEAQVNLIAGHNAWFDEQTKNMSAEEKASLSQSLMQEARDIVRQAVNDYVKSRGTLPGSLQELVDKILAPPIIPWLRILRDWVISTQRYKHRRSIRRPNRRHFGIPALAKFPGKHKDRCFTIAFLVDTSGSMGSEELSMALSLMQDLQRADRDIRITIIESDAAVGKVYEVGPSSEIDPRFTGRGGTDFNPALVEAKDHEPDVVFYYTDGYAPPPEVESRVAVPFAWLITPRGTVPDENWGHVIKLQDICG